MEVEIHMNIELSKFKVKQGKSERVDEWMQVLNKHMKEVLLTLKDEKMYVETIFREKDGEDEYLYWYSIQGTGGSLVEESNHEIDRIHLAFWEECIDPTWGCKDMDTQVVMIQEEVQVAIQELDKKATA
jgi:Family of unknown function (DUF6176)